MSNDTTDYGEIIVDGYHFPLAQGAKMQPSAVDRFPGKVTIGTDYTKDSNDLISSWIISDLTGGHGVVELKEGVEDNRYRFGTLYTRYPGQFTLPFEINELSLGSGAAAATIPLGDMYYSGVGGYEFYAIGGNLGNELFRSGVTTGVTYGSSFTNPSMPFTGTAGTTLLYTPTNTGYNTYNRAANTAQLNTSPDMVAFCLWDDKLIALDATGQLHYATAAAATTSFTSYGVGGKLDPSQQPRRLEVYYNRAGEPSVHVISDQGVWVFDAATPRLYRIPDLSGTSGFFGYASAVWRGNLYVSAGMDLLEWNGSVVRNIGLSRDEGLPYLYAFFISSLAPGQNALYASVQGPTQNTVPNLAFPHSVHEWSGFGWHCLYTATNTNQTPYQILVSRADNRLYWGYSQFGDLLWQDLPVGFTNPREAIDAGTFDFGYAAGSATTYYLETGRFDAGMTGYVKVANAIDVDVRTVATNQSVVVKYRIDPATSWTTLGTITTTGHTILPFGTQTSDGIYPGMPFETIEFRLEYVDSGAPSSDTSVVESMVFTFLKVMNPSWSWTVQLDLTGAHSGRSPEQMFDKLVALKDSGVFYAMKHRDDTYRIRIAGMGGADEAGKDKRGLYTLSIIEVPLKLGAPV
jgi:hypothetical protein